MKRRCWQIASGAEGRNYAWLFLKHDLMFLGPGRYGKYDETTYNRVVERGHFTAQKIGTVRSFREDVRPGDIILLREGYHVTAVGLAAEEDESDGYLHDQSFDDVYGWDLQHTRRVCWQPELTADLKDIQAGTKGLFSSRTSITTFSRVNDPKIRNPVEPLLSRCDMRPLKPRPDDIPPPLQADELGQKLFSRGLANDAVDSVLRTIERQKRLLAWYGAYGKQSARPNEHEVVAHMVLPLLLAMGWSEQLLAVEWKKVDLAAFSGTPTTAERCVMVCEAKQMRHGLQKKVWDQAIGYIKKHRLTGCRKVLLTQGVRFYLFGRDQKKWPAQAQPGGYINLGLIREKHIAPTNTNAVATLMALTPAGVERAVGSGP